MVAVYVAADTLGGRIREARESLGWSQGKLALMAGVEQTWLSNIEKGRNKRRLDIGYIINVARALNLSVDYLWTGQHRGEFIEVTGPEPEAARVRRYARLPKEAKDQIDRVFEAIGMLSVRDVQVEEPAPERDTDSQHRQSKRRDSPAS